MFFLYYSLFRYNRRKISPLIFFSFFFFFHILNNSNFPFRFLFSFISVHFVIVYGKSPSYFFIFLYFIFSFLRQQYFSPLYFSSYCYSLRYIFIFIFILSCFSFSFLRKQYFSSHSRDTIKFISVHVNNIFFPFSRVWISLIGMYVTWPPFLYIYFFFRVSFSLISTIYPSSFFFFFSRLSSHLIIDYLTLPPFIYLIMYWFYMVLLFILLFIYYPTVFFFSAYDNKILPVLKFDSSFEVICSEIQRKHNRFIYCSHYNSSFFHDIWNTKKTQRTYFLLEFQSLFFFIYIYTWFTLKCQEITTNWFLSRISNPRFQTISETLTKHNGLISF